MKNRLAGGEIEKDKYERKIERKRRVCQVRAQGLWYQLPWEWSLPLAGVWLFLLPWWPPPRPNTYTYAQTFTQSLPQWQKLISRRHFLKWVPFGSFFIWIILIRIYVQHIILRSVCVLWGLGSSRLIFKKASWFHVLVNASWLATYQLSFARCND